MHRRSNAAGLAPRAARGHVRLRFISPTAFSRDRHSVHLFPTGELVFRSLIEIWNDHARPAIDNDVANALLGSVREERHEIWTVPPVSFGKYRVKGFMGTCEYSADSVEQPAVGRLLHLLADFAFYSGVGLKRGMGMGEVLGESAQRIEDHGDTDKAADDAILIATHDHPCRQQARHL
jgi:CRISPR-associated endoribonuclease Cas6